MAIFYGAPCEKKIDREQSQKSACKFSAITCQRKDNDTLKFSSVESRT